MSENYQAVYDAVRSRMGSLNLGEVVRDVIWQSWDISHEKAGLAQEAYITLAEYQRPCVLFRPTLCAGARAPWTAVYCGVIGLGDSPDAAMRDFDEAWRKKVE